MKEIHYKTKL